MSHDRRARVASAALLAAWLWGLSAAVSAEVALESNGCIPAGSELRGDPANGRRLHREHCAACHGLTGQADVVVMHMDETPADQSDPAYMRNLPDEYLYLAICRGGEGVGKSYVMSPWGDVLSDTDIRDLIAWIRTFSAT